MREEDMIRELKKRGYKIEKNPIVTYNVEIGFATFVGVSETIEVDAPEGLDKDELLEYIMEGTDKYTIQDFLGVESVEDLGDGDYNVTINFAGYIGADEEYQVYADDEDDAVEQAIEEAFSDITVEDFTIEE